MEALPGLQQKVVPFYKKVCKVVTETSPKKIKRQVRPEKKDKTP